MEKNFETTFLISTFNNVEYIEECLDSIENQTYFKDGEARFQVLIGVDGCPQTYEKILEIKDKYRNLDVYNLEKNMGAYIALNTLIPHIKYDNIIVFGSDDVMVPEAIDILSKVDNQYDIVKVSL
jgi:glycosyltransferase involved in cell wall biosynthesis